MWNVGEPHTHNAFACLSRSRNASGAPHKKIKNPPDPTAADHTGTHTARETHTTHTSREQKLRGVRMSVRRVHGMVSLRLSGNPPVVACTLYCCSCGARKKNSFLCASTSRFDIRVFLYFSDIFAADMCAPFCCCCCCCVRHYHGNKKTAEVVVFIM